MKVAIVGSGYIGTALGVQLLEAGAAVEVRATTTSAARLDELASLGFKPYELVLGGTGESRRQGNLVDILRGTALVYFTAAAGGRQNIDRYRRIYVEGGRELVNAAAEAGVGRLIYTSSCSVYGQTDGGWVNEQSPTRPSTEHGDVLLEAERVLLDADEASSVESTILRLSGIYGPNRGPQNFADRLAGQEKTGGEAYLNLIHRDDVVEALVRLAAVRHRGVLNWSDDRPATRREYYDRILSDADLPLVRWIEDPSAAPGEDDRGKRVANGLAKRTLGLELRHPTH
jgi:nucleoside-diphosphate-sugar epimerase